MVIKKGIPVSSGVAIANAVVLDAEDQPIPRRTISAEQVENECKRLDKALAKSCSDIESLKKETTDSLGTESGKIFGFHLGMLQDKHLIEQFKQLIEEEHVTAEYAVFDQMRKLAKTFRQQESHYFRERVGDIWDMERRVLSHLIDKVRADTQSLRQDSVIIAYDLTPSQTASLDRTRVKGIATDAGGRTSHTAILAHALGIPVIVGLEGLTAEVNTGDTVIIDANSGQVIVNPDAAQLMEYRELSQIAAAAETSLDEQAKLPAVTEDGTSITISANIEFPDEIGMALKKGATGIGLYRTEFLFLASEQEPTEEEQYKAYKQAIRSLKGKPLTIRTLDLGADKIRQSDSEQSPPEDNPFLGCRSIRLCLQKLPLFKSQLRAILRASAKGKTRIMFPMICNIMELRQAKMILNDVIEDLDEEGVEFQRDIPVGIMIEVPSAALQAKVLAKEVSFFSIGTNDLIQYTLAVDRGNERIASLYTGAHPAIGQLIREVVKAADRNNIQVSLCGEMGGDPVFVMFLLGLGLRSLSITPPAIPEVKRIIRSVTIGQCQRVARKALGFDSDREVLNYLQDQLHRVAPDVFSKHAHET